MISGASAPIGCTISPPLATIQSTESATLSTITYSKRPGAEAGGRRRTQVLLTSPVVSSKAVWPSPRCRMFQPNTVCKTPPSARYRWRASQCSRFCRFARAGGIGSSFKGGRNRGFACGFSSRVQYTLLLARGSHLQLVELVVVWYEKPTRWNFPGSCGVKCFARGPDS